jgi:uncharacterized protein YbaP (TraB family)
MPAETAAPAVTSAAQPPMWRVSDADSEIYLLGTIHVLRPGADWRPGYLARALDRAEVLWLEADTEGREAQARAASFATAQGRLPAGQSLFDIVGPEEAEGLRAMAAKIGAPIADIETMRPWFAFLALSYFAAGAEGFDPNVGVEKVLISEWRARGRSIRYLESVEQQLGVLAGLAPEVERALLVESVHEWERGDASLEELFSAWWNGDETTIADIMNDSLRDGAPEVFNALVVRRNEDWAMKIEREMAGSGTELVAVGAGHLVGEGSLPALLEAKGFTVERYGAGETAASE